MSARPLHNRLRPAGKGKALRAALVAALSLWLPQEAFSAGTPAGTVISNRATVAYTMTGSNYTQLSNISNFMVDDKVSFTLSSSDASDVTVTPGGRAYMTYLLTNTGNAPHDFTLQSPPAATPTLAVATGPTFYSDTAGNQPLPIDANASGLPYVSNLAPDVSRTLYLYIGAPAQLTDGQSVDYLVTAIAYQPGNLGVVSAPVKSSAKAAVDETVGKNANLRTQFVVLADGHGNGGDADRDGKYSLIAKDGSGNPIGFKAKSASVNVVKSATITDQYGSSQPISGATVHYTLTVTASGSGNAVGVAISDPIPGSTSYVPGTLKLNGKSLTDAVDGDAGEVTSSGTGTMTVRLGDMTAATPVQTITFDVKID